MKTMLMLFTVLTSMCTVRGATILESSLSIPVPLVDGGTSSYLGGFAYFRVEGERINYQIWLSQGTTTVPTLSVNVAGHPSQDVALAFLGVQQIHGCELTPHSPYYGVPTWVGGLVLSPPGFDVPDLPLPSEPPYTCRAFSSWDVYEAAIIDSRLASLMTGQNGASLSIPTSFPSAVGPIQGSLYLVSIPEPSSALLVLATASSLMRRRRQNKITAASQLWPGSFKLKSQASTRP